MSRIELQELNFLSCICATHLLKLAKQLSSELLREVAILPCAPSGDSSQCWRLRRCLSGFFALMLTYPKCLSGILSCTMATSFTFLSAIAASIVASLQLACAELSLRNSHSYLISALPAYGFSRFIIGPLGDRRINQPTNTARHLKHPKHNGWYSRCLCTLKCSQAVPGWHSLCDSFS